MGCSRPSGDTLVVSEFKLQFVPFLDELRKKFPSRLRGNVAKEDIPLFLDPDAAIYALKRLQTKKRKIVDRRASKSRKIRYNVHEKLVNFMAPQAMELPPMTPKLFENLFGLKTMKSPNMM